MNYVGTLLGLGIGLMFVGILVGILYYVAFSWSHMKALKALVMTRHGWHGFPLAYCLPAQMQ